MALRIHALLVSEVIALLKAVCRVLRGAGADEPAERQTCAGAYTGTVTSIGGRARSSAQKRADNCAGNAADSGNAARCRSSQLLFGELPACEIITTELLERFICAGQHKHGRSGRHRCASSQRQQRKERRKF